MVGTRLKKAVEEFFQSFLEADRVRLPNFAPVPMGIGICFYFYLDHEPIFWINAVIFCVAILAAAIFHRFRILLMPLFLSLGFFVAQLRTISVNTPMLKEKIADPVEFTAEVESCERSDKGLVIYVRDVEVSGDDTDDDIEENDDNDDNDGAEGEGRGDDERCEILKNFRPQKLMLTWNQKSALENDYRPGEKVRFRAFIYPFFPRAFPGAYDFKCQQYFKEVSARGFIVEPPELLQTRPRNLLLTKIENLRHAINRRIESHLSKDCAAVTEALMTGNKTGISRRIRQNFSDSGTAHLLAISGLHVGVVGFFIFWLFRMFFCSLLCVSQFYSAKKLAAICSVPAVIFYLMLSGCSIPSIRACIMHILIIIGILISRVALTMRSIAIAAILILMATPEAIIFPGFQMSFGTVMAIVAFYEKNEKFNNRLIFSVIITTLIASIPSAIFSIFNFNQLTLNSVFANVISIPLVTFFIMPGVIITLIFMMFSDAGFFMEILGFFVDWLIKISEFAATLPGSRFIMPTPSLSVMAAVVFSGIIFALLHHRIRYIGLCGMAVGVVLYFMQELPDVFVSPYCKVVGLRTPDGAVFSKHNGGRGNYAEESWAKSVGLKVNFSRELQQKYFGEDPTEIYLPNGAEIDLDVFDGSDQNPEFTKLIYLRNGKITKIISDCNKKRPWM